MDRSAFPRPDPQIMWHKRYRLSEIQSLLLAAPSTSSTRSRVLAVLQSGTLRRSLTSARPADNVGVSLHSLQCAACLNHISRERSGAERTSGAGRCRNARTEPRLPGPDERMIKRLQQSSSSSSSSSSSLGYSPSFLTRRLRR